MAPGREEAAAAEGKGRRERARERERRRKTAIEWLLEQRNWRLACGCAESGARTEPARPPPTTCAIGGGRGTRGQRRHAELS